MKRSLLLFCCLVTAVVLSACGGEERFKETTSLEQFRESSEFQKEEEAKTKIKASEAPPVIKAGPEGGDYLLGPGDLLSIKVFESEELHTEVRVSSRGIVNLPLLKDVNVLNVTAAEAEQKIEDLYRENYLHDPHVSIYIKEHMSKQITLVGAVGKPGTYEYVSRRRLLDVLAMGSGLADNAGSIAYITREDPRSGESAYYMVDLDDLVKNGNMAYNYPILGSDVIFVPESGNCFVDGAVRKPGTYPITSNMTITEAISLAGGLAGWADDDKIKLIRYMGRGQERQVVSLSYTDLQAGVGDTLMLKDQDIIYAESSASGKLFSGAGFTLGFMGTGVSFRNPGN
ncbi:MAG: polysaccharide export protein [Desulfobulbaceae bacterium]|nr:polysaccharide export protein [Desulfobulbaceae bacterium]